MEVKADCVWACTVGEEGRCGEESLYVTGLFRSTHMGGFFCANVHYMIGQ